MVRFEISRNRLSISGRLRITDVDLLIEWCRGLLCSDYDEVTLDLSEAQTHSAAFVGAIAEISMQARAKGKVLIVKVAGRTADWLVHSGLHRVVRLQITGNESDQRP
jgi:anti-anti-sigma regulatory factor